MNKRQRIVVTRRKQNTRPKLLGVRQRIVVWVVATLLSVVSIWYGLSTSWDSYLGGRYWRNDSPIWMIAVPILLMGAATFVHFTRR
jgi:hypothetical protein